MPDKFKLITLLRYILLFLLLGCAENVTGPKPSAGNVLRFQVNFSEKYTKDTYKFYFVYSKKEIESPPGYPSGKYLFGPGDLNIDYDNGLFPSEISNETSRDVIVNYYYQNYFSTWSDYILFEKQGETINPVFYKPDNNYYPITSNEIEHAKYDELNKYKFELNNTYYFKYGDLGNGFYFEIQLSSLKNYPIVQDTLYFNFFAVDGNNKLVDTISDPANYAKMQNQANTFKDNIESNQSISPNIDIIYWKAEIR